MEIRSPELILASYSYSERQLYEQALDRMAREIAAVRKTDDAAAVSEIEAVLNSSALKAEKAAADALAEEAENAAA